MQHEIEHEERMISGKPYHYEVSIEKIRQGEIRQRFQNKYNGIEWLPDGRRVIDEDYELEAP